MIAVSRVAVNHDCRGGVAPDPTVWDQGGLMKRRRVDVKVNVDLASLLGPPGSGSPWVMWVPGWCSGRASKWYIEAPPLHQAVR